MKHASMAELALLAGGDLGWVRGWQVKWHVRGCTECREALAEFRALREELAEEGTALPAGIQWEELEAEMRGNIRLGLDVGAITERAAPADGADWAEERGGWWKVSRPLGPGAAVAASLALVVALVWMLSRPPVSHAPERAMENGTLVLAAWGTGVEVRQGNEGMTLLAPAEQAAERSVDLGAGARAEYVDGDTGQVTIHQVFHGEE